MIDRRFFLGSSAALGAAGLLGLPGWNAGQPFPQVTLLFDGLTPDGRDFAAHVRALGFDPRDTGRDVAGLLYGPLRRRLASPDAIFAGVTRYADFTVAAGISRERGLKPGDQTGDLGGLLRQVADRAADGDSHFWIFARKG